MICENPHCEFEATKWLHDKMFCFVHYLLEKSKEDLEESK
jgi:hypothetical protein